MKQAWNRLRDAAAGMAARWRGRPARIKLSPLSAEWLRKHEIEANKHAAGG